jgi:hypothetical protein
MCGNSPPKSTSPCFHNDNHYHEGSGQVDDEHVVTVLGKLAVVARHARLRRASIIHVQGPKVIMLVVVMVVMVGQTHVIVLWASMSLSVGYPVPGKRAEKAELMGLGPRLHSAALSVWC